MLIDTPSTAEQTPERAVVVGVLRNAIEHFVYPLMNRTNSRSPRIMLDYISAAKFLFDDDYLIDWGDWVISPKDLLSMVDLNLVEIRKLVRKKKTEVGFSGKYSNKEHLLSETKGTKSKSTESVGERIVYKRK